jgi:hypothetical protein
MPPELVVRCCRELAEAGCDERVVSTTSLVREMDRQVVVYVDATRVNPDHHGRRGEVGSTRPLAWIVLSEIEPDSGHAKDGEARR